MASDNRAGYARIGFAVVAGVAAIVATLIYLGGYADKANELLIESYYDHSVSGLSVGSAVNLRGVKVGEVRHIGFVVCEYPEADDDDAQRIRIVMALSLKAFASVPREKAEDYVRNYVEHGLHATVVSSGITGISRIELAIVKDAPPPAKMNWRPEYLLVPPSPSLFENIATAAARALNGFNRMDFTAVMSNVQSVAESAALLSANANELVESQRAGIAAIVRDVAAMAEDVRALAADVKDNPSLLLRPNDPKPLPETQR